MELLVEYPWPGNIRELQNIIERAVVLTKGSVLSLEPSLLPKVSSAGKLSQASAAASAKLARPVSEDSSAFTSLPSLEAMERNHILAALKQTSGVIEGPRGAARILDLHPNTLRSRLVKLGIDRKIHEIS